jgi:hypothetical protein
MLKKRIGISFSCHGCSEIVGDSARSRRAADVTASRASRSFAKRPSLRAAVIEILRADGRNAEGSRGATIARGRPPGHARAHSRDEDMTGNGGWSYLTMKPIASATGSASDIAKSNSAPNAEIRAGPGPRSAHFSSTSRSALVVHTPAIELISHLAMKSAADGVREAQFDRAKAETVFIPNTHCRQITAGHKPPKLNLRHAEQHPELAERQEAFINDFCALQFRRRCVDNSCDVCQDHWPVPV